MGLPYMCMKNKTEKKEINWQKKPEETKSSKLMENSYHFVQEKFIRVRKIMTERKIKR